MLERLHDLNELIVTDQVRATKALAGIKAFCVRLTADAAMDYISKAPPRMVLYIAAIDYEDADNA